MRTASLHCIATLFNECKALYLAFTSRFLYLSGTLICDRAMNSDANELQMDQPFDSGALCDRRHSSSAILFTGKGPGSDAIVSMAVLHDDWNQNIKRRNETISVLLIVC